MELKNYMEDFVLDKLDELIPHYPDYCWCDDCKRDVAILALNHLPPKYISTDKGQILTRAECLGQQYDVEIVKQIAAAVAIVKAHPRHKTA